MPLDRDNKAGRSADRLDRFPSRGGRAVVRGPPSQGEASAEVETGTTIVGLTAEDAVVLAADRRASAGGRFVTNKDVRKVEPVHPTAAAALSGPVGGIQRFVRTLRAEAQLYAERRGEPMSMTALSTLAGTVLRGGTLRVQPLIGGVDEEGPRLFSLDAGGSVLEDDYVAGGSGMQVAYGTLERAYEPDMGPEAAREVASAAVASAIERDTASGNGRTVVTVTADGIETEAVGESSGVA